MAFVCGNREQQSFLPPSIEDYISKDDPVRVYDAFVEQLDMDSLGLCVDTEQSGHPRYDPVAMLKLLVYGTSYGIRSGRKLERATHHNLSFIWLTGGLHPDYRTISRFRRSNKKVLSRVLSQCARLCCRLGLIEGNTLFIDSTRIRGNASLNSVWDKKRCDKALANLDERIDTLLSECDLADESEAGQGSLVKIKSELADKKKLMRHIQKISEEISSRPKPKHVSASICLTDKDSVRINGRHGSGCGYSGHFVTDEKHGLIISSDVVSQNNDSNQFSKQVKQAEDVLNTTCKCVVADAGYHDLKELQPIAKRNTKVLVPTQRQASNKKAGTYSKESFAYNVEEDTYTCPHGQTLIHTGNDLKRRQKLYHTKPKHICKACAAWGKCTKSKKGRKLTRSIDEAVRDKLKSEYEKAESRKIFAKRKTIAEKPFGHLRANLNFNSFLLRGIEGVKAEFALAANAFNIRRLITIFGTRRLITVMQQ